MADPNETRRAARRATWQSLRLLALVLVILALAFGTERLRRESLGDAPGGPFTLVDSRGETVRDIDFRGQYMLIHFGDTYSPDGDPARLRAMGAALTALDPARAARVQPLFITLDPERDTPAHLAAYLRPLHPRFKALTGAPEAVAQVAAAYEVTHERVGQGPTALVAHPGRTYLMGPEGGYVTHFGPEATAEALAAALRTHIPPGEPAPS